jgi:hypothetical protein
LIGAIGAVCGGNVVAGPPSSENWASSPALAEQAANRSRVALARRARGEEEGLVNNCFVPAKCANRFIFYQTINNFFFSIFHLFFRAHISRLHQFVFCVSIRVGHESWSSQMGKDST